MIDRLLTPVLLIALIVATANGLWQWRQAGQARTELAEYRVTVERQTREAVQAARTEETRRHAATQEALDAAHTARIAAEADALAAGLAAERLRQRTQALATAARRPTADPAPAPGSPPALSPAHPGDLLADMLGRLDEAAGELGRYADAAHIAGTACERAYRALSP